MTPQQFHKLISNVRLPLEDEKETQAEIEKRLAGCNFEREKHLDPHNIPDFFFPETGLAVEVKLKGSKRDIYRQIVRYAGFSEVRCIILVTARGMGLPSSINNKPTYRLNISQSWL